MDFAVLHGRSILGGDERVQSQHAPGRLGERRLVHDRCPRGRVRKPGAERQPSGQLHLSQAIQYELDCAKHATFGGVDERPERAARADAGGLACPVAIEFVLRDELQRHLT